MMKKHGTLFYAFLLSALVLGSQFLVACSGSPGPQEAVIEETQGGFDLLDREFGECNESLDENSEFYERKYAYRRPMQNSSSGRSQLDLEAQFPHSFQSLGQMYPNGGTWRQDKEEIMDIVGRYIWSPEKRRPVQLLNYFDMALMINVADRNSDTPDDSSAQRMQILIRQGDSNDINDWKRIETWSISSGRPCGNKIATMTGVFKLNPDRIYSKYNSELFDNADMYETMFLYHNYQNGRQTGIAIHGTYKTPTLGKQDSGGCVRVYREKSKCLFETITGTRTSRCLSGGLLDYQQKKTISLLPKNGEADPEFLSSGMLEVDGYRVLVVIFNDESDLL